MSLRKRSPDPVQLSTHQIHLGIVCPMANEEETAVQFVRDVLQYCQDFPHVSFFAVLDCASRDRTLSLLQALARQDNRLNVVWAPENRCVVDAYLRGYREALTAHCDWILEIDAGYSHQPADLPRFFQMMARGYDCVFGTRFHQAGRFQDLSVLRYCLSRFGGLLSNLLLGMHLTDMTSGFELFSRAALQYVIHQGIHSNGHFFQTEIKFHCRHFAIAEVPITYRSPSPSVNLAVIKDALKNLWRLFRLRWQREYKQVKKYG